MGWRGIATGVLALVAIQVLVQPEASGRLSDLFGVPGALARRFIDPSIPAIGGLDPNANVANASSGQGTGGGFSTGGGQGGGGGGFSPATTNPAANVPPGNSGNPFVVPGHPVVTV